MCMIYDASQIHFHMNTTSTPEAFVAGLTDFGPGRPKLFNNSADEYLKVHHLDRTAADVTEGSGGIWERLHYYWSDPNRVVLTTTDSNVWSGLSGHTYTFTRQPNATTDIDLVVVRDAQLTVVRNNLGFEPEWRDLAEIVVEDFLHKSVALSAFE